MAIKPDDMFYEIEYDSNPIPGVGKFVMKPKSQKIAESEKDEIRDRFTQMRDIARAYRASYYSSSFYDRRTQGDNAVIFYKQGMFMKDFTDNYSEEKPFNQYFPYYQMMGYEQLRTYFTWRTKVRDGVVLNTSLSYAFMYIYELLCNIGVEGPQDGLDKLMFFFKEFGEHNRSISKYVLYWLKDYHIYYELPHSFKEFVELNGLWEYYPKLMHDDGSFGLYCAISKYDIRKSKFFTDDRLQMIAECFAFIMGRIKQEFEAGGIHFDDAFFRPTRKLMPWKPFRDALFYNPGKRPDRKIVFSENEIYICKNGSWRFSTVITTEKGRQFISYVMKQMEATLRHVTKYKYKLTANIGMVNEDTIRVLEKAGLFIEKIVPSAVLEYYREATKTVVTVNHAALARIREEALHTQEALIVEEGQKVEEMQKNALPAAMELTILNQNIFADHAESEQDEEDTAFDIWDSFRNFLDDNELKALSVVLLGKDLKTFADECGIMLEVLVDGINEKAMDSIGDNLMDDDFMIYDDYAKQVKDLIK